jgi:ABC-2 type transport system ATP-binding protein
MGVVEAVCDRVVVMAGGRIRADDSVDALLAGDAHTLRLTSPDFTDDRRAHLRREFDLRHVGTHPSGTRIEVRVDDADLYRLMRYLEAENVRLERVRTVESDLADLLLSLAAEGKA